MLAIYLALAFGVADFTIGRDWFSRMKLPGRSVWYIAPLLMLVLWHYWALGLGYCLWRSVFGWSSGGGSMDPQGRAEIEAELFRNGYCALLFLMPTSILYLSGKADWIMAVLFTSISTSLAAIYGHVVKYENRDVGPYIEAARGALFGLMYGLTIMYGGGR